ncbi:MULTISPECIES: carboxymuconolactone decarboxylase family protein [unclassified Nocardioides]|uniref:carboxymuconolactone decarboxylase family protein n=1 Tax=unclassified Nocardioides TaxID=2615069 RepID=UPI00105507BD|nr:MULTISPECIES: hypothetical protein [unclassified Nocardioides]
MEMVQGCERCLQSHIDAARGLRIGEDEIELARHGTSSGPRYAAMIAYGLQVYREPTIISDEQIEALRSHGFSDREIADVDGLVAPNVLTGGFNLVAGLQSDPGHVA